MNHPAEDLLTHDLERCIITNESWRDYVRSRAIEVQVWVAHLRAFAALRPGRVADYCYQHADALQQRLDAVLAK